MMRKTNMKLNMKQKYQNAYPTIDKEKTAKRIKYQMDLHKLRPTDIQEYLGLTCVQTVYRWLDGTNIPSVDHLYALSQIFQISVDDMLAGTREIPVGFHYSTQYARLRIYHQKLAENVA